MATAALISVSEYLRSSYEPHADFVDGRIEERLLGELDHGELQAQLLVLLRDKAHVRYFRCTPELRVQTGPNRYRVPDLCLCAAGAPREQIVVTAPLLCVEILSREETMMRTLVRVHEFLAMGVPEVWVFDPATRTVQVCSGTTMKEYSRGTLNVPKTPVVLSLLEVFSVLDEM